MIRTFVLGLAAAAPIAMTVLASATPAAAYDYGYQKQCHYEYRQVRVSDGYGGYKYVTHRVEICH